jgi:hypothetical protein
MAADAESIDTWWRGQDPTRAPRFDVTPFACGLQPDISVVRLPQSAAQLAAIQSRAASITVGVEAAGLGSRYGKYVVYYDGPSNDVDVCGQAGGRPDSGPSYALVYLAACTDVPTETTAAHELLHALGALPSGAPHSCSPADRGHPCDSEQDVLYPFASGAPLSGLLLDAGRDDYYAHAGSWFDLQDSAWLRMLDAQVALAVSVEGGGRVTTVQPGPDCTAACSADWNRGSTVMLQAEAPAGRRLLRWSGACRGDGACSVTLNAPASVVAVFGPARFRLSVSVAGKGVVRSVPAGIACRGRCSAAFTSYKLVRLRATPAKGWRFARWSGACAGRRSTCAVPLSKAAAALAVFARAS